MLPEKRLLHIGADPGETGGEDEQKGRIIDSRFYGENENTQDQDIFAHMSQSKAYQQGKDFLSVQAETADQREAMNHGCHAYQEGEGGERNIYIGDQAFRILPAIIAGGPEHGQEQSKDQAVRDRLAQIAFKGFHKGGKSVAAFLTDYLDYRVVKGGAAGSNGEDGDAAENPQDAQDHHVCYFIEDGHKGTVLIEHSCFLSG